MIKNFFLMIYFSSPSHKSHFSFPLICLGNPQIQFFNQALKISSQQQKFYLGRELEIGVVEIV